MKLLKFVTLIISISFNLVYSFDNFKQAEIKLIDERCKNRLEFYIDLPKLDPNSLFIAVTVETIDVLTSEKNIHAAMFKFIDQSLGLRINQKDIEERIKDLIKNKKIIFKDIFIYFSINGKEFGGILETSSEINLKKGITIFKISNVMFPNRENNILDNILAFRNINQSNIDPIYLIKEKI